MVNTYLGIIVSYEKFNKNLELQVLISHILERVPEQAVTAFRMPGSKQAVNQVVSYLFIFHASQIISARLPYSLQYLGAN